MFRARIVAVVSSEEQAADDRASLDVQISTAREAIRRHGWQEVGAPLRIWQSRDYYSLADLLAESPDYADLLAQAEAGEIDLIVGRDHSRVLGRTEAIQVAIRNHLALCRVQCYFYTAPVHPTPPAQLGRRGRAQIGARYLDAIAAVRDEEEVARLVQRREDGMNRKAERGEWGMAGVPFGYRRPILTTQTRGENPDGSPRLRHVYGPLEVDPEQAELLVGWHEAYLQGATYADIDGWWRDATGRPRQAHAYGPVGAVQNMMQNPAYIGVMVYGRRRQDVAIEAGKARKVTRYVITPDRKAELGEAWALGEDARSEEELAAGIIVAWGNWPAIVPLELWRAVQRERRTRGPSPRSAYSKPGSSRAIYPLSGLLRCGHCGATLATYTYAYIVRDPEARERTGNYEKRPRLGCTRIRAEGRKGCPASKTRMEHLLRAELLTLLERYAQQAGLLERLLALPAPSTSDEEEEARLARRIEQAERAIARWDAAYEAGDLALDAWRDKTTPHRQALGEAQDRLKGLRAQAALPDARERAAELREAFAALPDVEDDPVRLKTLLRQHIAEITVTSGHISRIEFH